MAVSGESYAFTETNVDVSPANPGVYELLKGSETIYIGMSTSSIRARLQAHQRGDEGAGTQSATDYKREVTTAAEAPAYEARLLAAYKRQHGKLPRYNEKAS